MIENVQHDISRAADTARNEVGAFFWLMRWSAIAAVAGAIWMELRKPPEERTWNGRLLGFIPYDFRLPTLSRLRDAYWNTGSDRLFSPRVVGVGWALNIPAALRRLGIMDRT